MGQKPIGKTVWVLYNVKTSILNRGAVLCATCKNIIKISVISSISNLKIALKPPINRLFWFIIHIKLSDDRESGCSTLKTACVLKHYLLVFLFLIMFRCYIFHKNIFYTGYILPFVSTQLFRPAKFTKFSDVII